MTYPIARPPGRVCCRINFFAYTPVMSRLTIRKLSEIETENIYDFKRKLIFSPSVTPNHHLRLAMVEGNPGASSQEHRHPGDEVVFTVQGSAVNLVEGESYQTRPQTALCIAPGCIHSSRVISREPWVGISAYCDDCPLMQARTGGKIKCSHNAVRERDLSECASDNYGGLMKRTLFCPSLTGNRHISFSILEHRPGTEKSPLQPLPTESIVLTLSGKGQITLEGRQYHLTAQTAVCLAPDRSYSFSALGSQPWVAIIVSCDDCPLIRQEAGTAKGPQ